MAWERKKISILINQLQNKFHLRLGNKLLKKKLQSASDLFFSNKKPMH